MDMGSGGSARRWSRKDAGDDDDDNNITTNDDDDDDDADTVLSWRFSKTKPCVRDLATGFDRSKTATTSSASAASSVAHTPSSHHYHHMQTYADAGSPERRSSAGFWGNLGAALFPGAGTGTGVGAGEQPRPAVAGLPMQTPVRGQIGADLAVYRLMEAEGPVGTDADGTQVFRYKELVRKNFLKDYTGIVHRTELERHCDDVTFAEAFGMSKDAFAALPSWKKIQQKKQLLLF
jgi:hypothetical protein